jgi:hypothetical protein
MLPLALSGLLAAAGGGGEAAPGKAVSPVGDHAAPAEKADGYRGIWFSLGQKSKYGDKYSGGLGTYPANMVPMAIHAPSVKKTFFVWGGTPADGKGLQIMVSYYDHERGVVPRPTIVRDGGGFGDPHANPAVCLDASGYVWVFSATRHAFQGRKYRSSKPYDIERFDLVESRTMAYPQPWWVEGKGFLFLFTQYTRGRELYWQTSEDGHAWSEPKKLAGMGGHYQTTCCGGGVVASAFNYHPGGNVDKRTNLYYVQTRDYGRTWTTADGKPLDVPLSSPAGPALVRDYAAEKSLVYIHDLNFDAAGRPVVLYLTAKDHRPGPDGDPRQWHTARWAGASWDFRAITASTANYDVGCLHVEADGAWRLIGPTEPGPQRWGTGGEMAMWLSRDQGATWRKAAALTAGSARNHTYARRPLGAHPDFYAFWADGDTEARSESRLYFATRDGGVFQLPGLMKEDFARPVPVRAGAGK